MAGGQPTFLSFSSAAHSFSFCRRDAVADLHAVASTSKSSCSCWCCSCSCVCSSCKASSLASVEAVMVMPVPSTCGSRYVLLTEVLGFTLQLRHARFQGTQAVDLATKPWARHCHTRSAESSLAAYLVRASFFVRSSCTVALSSSTLLWCSCSTLDQQASQRHPTPCTCRCQGNARPGTR